MAMAPVPGLDLAQGQVMFMARTVEAQCEVGEVAVAQLVVVMVGTPMATEVHLGLAPARAVSPK